jgi:hypothetical protein
MAEQASICCASGSFTLPNRSFPSVVSGSKRDEWFFHPLGEAPGPFHTSRQRVLHAESQTSSALACLEVLQALNGPRRVPGQG